MRLGVGDLSNDLKAITSDLSTWDVASAVMEPIGGIPLYIILLLALGAFYMLGPDPKAKRRV